MVCVPDTRRRWCSCPKGGPPGSTFHVPSDSLLHRRRPRSRLPSRIAVEKSDRRNPRAAGKDPRRRHHQTNLRRSRWIAEGVSLICSQGAGGPDQQSNDCLKIEDKRPPKICQTNDRLQPRSPPKEGGHACHMSVPSRPSIDGRSCPHVCAEHDSIDDRMVWTVLTSCSAPLRRAPIKCSRRPQGRSCVLLPRLDAAGSAAATRVPGGPAEYREGAARPAAGNSHGTHYPHVFTSP
jgi:hypothetical protein